MSKGITFNKPCFAGHEHEYINEAIANEHISGKGKFTDLCQGVIEEESGCKKALLTTSCTHALEMCALMLDLKEGDEVILPSFTFVSTANAFALRGPKLVFADIRQDTKNIDETKLEKLITPRTRAIVVVHYAGVACEMDTIMAIAERHNVAVVEDNAHGFLGSYKGRPLGSIGALATLSFHETKNIVCGEGGALLINDSSFIDHAEIILDKGTNRQKFFKGEVDKYTWVSLGSSYLMSDILAAFLFAQLEHRKDIQTQRRNIWNYYNDNLKDWSRKNSVELPVVPEECSQPYHMFYLLMPDPGERSRILKHLKKQHIHAVFHYQSLHRSDMGSSVGINIEGCPVTEIISDTILRLPFYNNMTTDQQNEVIEALKSFSCFS
ncbi:MAG: dTDP-4-amino-4,6-dideoxygalactose transaminase [Planctomycetota bacterium]